MAQDVVTPTQTREDVDAVAIRQTVMAYSAAWSAGDPARMERSVHPDLAKRIVRPAVLPVDWKLDGDWLEHLGALRLVQETRHPPYAAEQRPGGAEVTLLDRFENAASVKRGTDEYHHVARWNGRWVIVNILGGVRPEARPASPATADQAQGETDEAAIRQTALDYIESCYDADPLRMERSLYPDLAKRIVVPGAASRGDRLDQLSALGLVQLVRRWPALAEKRRADVTILDRSENAASVRTDAITWMDYMHLARHTGQGRWMIVNVLWAERPAGAVS